MAVSLKDVARREKMGLPERLQSELIKEIASKSGMTKKAAGEAVHAVLEVITETLKSGEPVGITGFGAFTVLERAGRRARNPRTGEEIEVAASRSVSFKVGKGLKDAVNE